MSNDKALKFNSLFFMAWTLGLHGLCLLWSILLPSIQSTFCTRGFYRFSSHISQLSKMKLYHLFIVGYPNCSSVHSFIAPVRFLPFTFQTSNCKKSKFLESSQESRPTTKILARSLIYYCAFGSGCFWHRLKAFRFILC